MLRDCLSYNTVNFEPRKHSVASNTQTARMRMLILIFALLRLGFFSDVAAHVNFSRAKSWHYFVCLFVVFVFLKEWPIHSKTLDYLVHPRSQIKAFTAITAKVLLRLRRCTGWAEPSLSKMIQGPLNQIALCGGGGCIFLILKISYYEQTPFFLYVPAARSGVQINEGLDWVVPLKS